MTKKKAKKKNQIEIISVDLEAFMKEQFGLSPCRNGKTQTVSNHQQDSFKKALELGGESQKKLIAEMLGIDADALDEKPEVKPVKEDPIAITKKPARFAPRPKLTNNERKAEKWQFVLRFPPELKEAFMAHCKENGLVYRRVIVKLIKDYMGKQK